MAVKVWHSKHAKSDDVLIRMMQVDGQVRFYRCNKYGTDLRQLGYITNAGFIVFMQQPDLHINVEETSGGHPELPEIVIPVFKVWHSKCTGMNLLRLEEMFGDVLVRGVWKNGTYRQSCALLSIGGDNKQLDITPMAWCEMDMPKNDSWEAFITKEEK